MCRSHDNLGFLGLLLGQVLREIVLAHLKDDNDAATSFTGLPAGKFMLLFTLIIKVSLHQCTPDVFEQLALDDIQSCHIKIAAQRRHPSDITVVHVTTLNDGSQGNKC